MTDPVEAVAKAIARAVFERGECHEAGCTLEKCPRCGWQAIACWCASPVEEGAGNDG